MMWIHRLLLGCAASLMLLSCAHSYELDREMQSFVLSPDSSLYVCMPEPGRYDAKIYEMSGRQTGVAIVQAFAPHVEWVILGREIESDEVARGSARVRSANYLVCPKIMHWEDRATNWSGIPDRLRVEIRIYDVSSGKLLDFAQVYGEGNRSMFGSDHPEDLLERAVGDYVDLLFVGGQR